jgi:hypothetical protein
VGAYTIEVGDDSTVSAPLDTSRVSTNLTTAEQPDIREIWMRRKYPVECQLIDLLEKGTEHLSATQSTAANAATAAAGATE